MAGSTEAHPLRHLAIIMDGNGRWAAARGLARVEGHRAGAENVLRIVDAVHDAGIEYLTLYAFSTENWKRSPAEVAALMDLLSEFLDEKLPTLQERGVRLKTIGRTAGLPLLQRKKLEKVIAATAGNRNGTLVLALNYGGRAEIADAARGVAEAVKAGTLKPSQVDEALFAKFLCDPELPDPDLMIRTSGEMRLSNFLLWELAYTELYVTDAYWPDFDRAELAKALEAFSRRDRRFGGRKA